MCKLIDASLYVIFKGRPSYNILILINILCYYLFFFRISKLEYVGIIIDVLKLRKNICISRHFQGLNKSSLFRPDRASIFGTKSRKKLYLDVWLVDFFSPSLTDVTDTTRSYQSSHFTYLLFMSTSRLTKVSYDL